MRLSIPPVESLEPADVAALPEAFRLVRLAVFSDPPEPELAARITAARHAARTRSLQAARLLRTWMCE
jgi:hypothetical protein